MAQDLKIKPKVTNKDGKPGLIFGKGAKFRPFGGVIARALLGEDEKFGGDRGAIDFVRPKKKPQKKSNGGEMKKKGYSTGGAAGLSPAQRRMLRSAQGYAQDTGQNPAELQRLTAQYGDLNAAQRRAMAEAKKDRRRSGRRGSAPKMQSGGMMKSKMASKGGSKKFPDLTGDGKVTQADILKGRGVKKKPPGMMGGGMMKSKMASKGGKMGGKIPPGMKKGGSVKAKAPVRKKARGVGAAKRGFGKAMR